MRLLFSFLAAAAQGAIDEDAFYNAFEAVPKIQVFNFPLICNWKILELTFTISHFKLYSAKDLDQHMSQINECLTNLNNDWEKRVDSVI